MLSTILKKAYCPVQVSPYPYLAPCSGCQTEKLKKSLPSNDNFLMNDSKGPTCSSASTLSKKARGEGCQAEMLEFKVLSVHCSCKPFTFVQEWTGDSEGGNN